MRFREEYGLEFRDNDEAVFPHGVIAAAFTRRSCRYGNEHRDGKRAAARLQPELRPKICAGRGPRAEHRSDRDCRHRTSDARRRPLRQRAHSHLADRFDVRHLARLPLGLSYPEVVAEVGRLLHRPPLADNCELVIDETGVGRAVADIFDNAGLRPLRVTITAGSEQTQHSGRAWHVPKQVLISTLDARLHTGELKFAAELGEASTMQDELKDFRRKVSAAGRYSYEARVGKHDDLVLAVAIGLWSLVGRPNQTAAIVETGFF